MYKAAIITVSDKGSKGLREDKAGPKIKEILLENGYLISDTIIIPDDYEEIKKNLILFSDKDIPLIVTTGGTGFSPRDITPEATLAVCERLTPGIPEQMRAESLKITNRAILSRSVAGIRKRSLIINLPGSPKAALENLLSVLDSIEHGLDILREKDSECASST